MNLPVHYRAAARADVRRRSRRYARIDADLSRRLLIALAEMERQIAAAPSLGNPWPTTRKRLTNLRYAHVIGFEDLLFFYRETATEIVVMRVLHTRQNISRIFPVNGQS